MFIERYSKKEKMRLKANLIPRIFIIIVMWLNCLSYSAIIYGKSEYGTGESKASLWMCAVILGMLSLWMIAMTAVYIIVNLCRIPPVSKEACDALDEKIQKAIERNNACLLPIIISATACMIAVHLINKGVTVGFILSFIIVFILAVIVFIFSITLLLTRYYITLMPDGYRRHEEETAEKAVKADNGSQGSELTSAEEAEEISAKDAKESAEITEGSVQQPDF